MSMKKLFAVLAMLSIMAGTFFVPSDSAMAYSSDSKASDYIHDNKVPIIVGRIFQDVFGKKINKAESDYWKKRARTDKATEAKLKGAMQFQKGKN